MTFLNFIGSIVVLDFINLETGNIKISIPIKRIRIETNVWFGIRTTSTFFDDKKLEKIKINFDLIFVDVPLFLTKIY